MTSAAPGSTEWRGPTWLSWAVGGQPARCLFALPMGRPNLTVHPGCLVTSLHVRDGRCTGVDTCAMGRRPGPHRRGGDRVRGRGRLAVPAPAVRHRPAGQLRDLGIGPAADLPGVGHNLQDHPVALACYCADE